MPKPLYNHPAQATPDQVPASQWRLAAALISLGLLCSACSPKQAEPGAQSTNSSPAAASAPADTAAESSSPADTASANPLLHSHWQLTQLRGEPVTSSNPERAAHIVFGAANRIAGSDGCNRLMGSYSLEGGQLTLGQLVSTRMACLDNTAPAEAFTQALAEVAGYRLAEDQLELLGAGGESLASFTRGEQP